MTSRAVHEIEADAHKLLVKIESAIEVNDGIAIHRLAEQLQDVAQRFLHHKSLETAKAIGIGNHQEREER